MEVVLIVCFTLLSFIECFVCILINRSYAFPLYLKAYFFKI